jgi:hypothetical protein
MKTDMPPWILGGRETSTKVVQLQNTKTDSKIGMRKENVKCNGQGGKITIKHIQIQAIVSRCNKIRKV